MVLGGLVGCGDEPGWSWGRESEPDTQEVTRTDSILTRNLPPNTSAEMLEEGRELYLVCAPCHGAEGVGTQLGPPLHDPEWIGISGDFEEIQRVIRDGVPAPQEYPIPMPRGGGGNFDDNQIRAISTYVYVMSH